ncbi:hypothetical protein Phi40:1_gp022 [Cellulophaga phage phi40:1]|uniref:Uncharacterized protein n=1 Tax=Cellulophaga phage phi38:1 TaxID=1327977 RepID=S0A0P3_9CAUD|nr:hypothetical protein Phi38:1_gp022 [Cellulophaga phage phi38:1]AGO47887.1 hypothetical protein Phi40:1_gp022 [Cellulophaga phage phi40:1]AGO48052.1 hypothetical protein Phi38:1_gp022 [Cellulophaga phage phi38:1]
MKEQIEKIFRSGQTESDFEIYKKFLRIINKNGSKIFQKGINKYIILNESEGCCITVGGRVVELIQNGNIILLSVNEAIADKMVKVTVNRIESKVKELLDKVDALRVKVVKGLKDETVELSRIVP